MKHRRLLLSFLTLVGLMFVLSCQDNAEQDVDNGKTAIEFDRVGIELGGEAGRYSLKYSIKNGIDGIDIATECDAEWITNLGTENGYLVFDYEQNLESAIRGATIMVTYPNATRVILTVKQNVNSKVTFNMEITSRTTTSCSTKITPSDDETIYIAYMAEVDYLNGKFITTPEELFMDDYDYFMGFAKQVDAPMLKEFFLYNYFAYQGENNIDWTGMMPGYEYVLYVYAVEFNTENNDYYLTSPITYQMVTLEGPELKEVEFDVDIVVDGPHAEYTIKPIDWSGKYYLTVYSEEEFMYLHADVPVDDYYARLVSDTWISNMSSLIMSGYTADDLLEIMCLEGNDSYGETLLASTNYALVIYAVENVDGLPQVTSIPQVFNFRTEEIGPSDMTFEIKVENNYARVADITITPSTIEPYTAAIIPKALVPAMENSELITWLNKNLIMEEYRNEISYHLNTLAPETEYSILVYGYWGGTVTTDLFCYDFKTEAAGECENSVVRVDFNAPYSLVELEQHDPDKYYGYGQFEYMGYYGMWAEIITEQPTPDLFYCIYKAEELVTGGTDAIFADLVEYTCNKSQFLTGMNDTLYVMCAVAMDYRGNYSEMWVSEPFSYNLNASTKRPISEYIEKVHGVTAEPQRKSATNKGITNLLAK